MKFYFTRRFRGVYKKYPETLLDFPRKKEVQNLTRSISKRWHFLLQTRFTTGSSRQKSNCKFPNEFTWNFYLNFLGLSRDLREFFVDSRFLCNLPIHWWSQKKLKSVKIRIKTVKIDKKFLLDVQMKIARFASACLSKCCTFKQR